MPSASGLEGGIPLMLTRAATVAALLSLFGALVFQAYVAPRALIQAKPADGARADRLLTIIVIASIAAAAVTLPAWLLLQASAMAAASSMVETLAAAPVVMMHTMFGHLIGLQAAGVFAAAVAYGQRNRRRWAALALAGIAVALQARHGHAAAMDDGPSLLLAASVIHVLAAGAWLGGLIPLALFVAATPARTGAMAARWFSPLGKICVVAVTGSAMFQSWILVGSISGLVGTPYGRAAAVKIGLLGVLTGFAVLNRYRLAPALLTGEAGRRVLVCSIVAQTGFALAVIVAAAVLSGTPPAMDVQPVWPFAHLFTKLGIGRLH